MKKTSVGFKIGLITSLLHLGYALLCYAAYADSCSSTAGLLFLPFMVLDAPLTLLWFGSGGGSPLFIFGVLGSLLWFLIPWLTGRLIHRCRPSGSGVMKAFSIVGVMVLVLCGFVGLSTIGLGLSVKGERPEELKRVLNKPSSDYLTQRVVYTGQSMGRITSISQGDWVPNAAPETLVCFNRGTVRLSDAYEVQNRTAYTNYYAALTPIPRGGDAAYQLLAYDLNDAALLLDSSGEVIWRHDERSGREGPIDGVIAGDMDGDGSPEFAVRRRYGDGFKLLNEQGETRWTNRFSSIDAMKMVDVRGDATLEFLVKNGRDFVTVDISGNEVNTWKLSNRGTDFAVVEWPREAGRPNLVLSGENVIQIVDLQGNVVRTMDAPGNRSYGEINAVTVRFQAGQPAHLAIRKNLHPDIEVLYVYDANGSLVFYEAVPSNMGRDPTALAAVSNPASGAEVLLVARASGSRNSKLVEFTLSPTAQVAPVKIQHALFPADAVIEGGIRVEDKPSGQCLGYWTNPDDTITFHLPALEPGTYRLTLHYAAHEGCGGTVSVALNDLVRTYDFEATGRWDKVDARELEPYTHEGGALAVTLSMVAPNRQNEAVMNVFSLQLDQL